MVLPELGKHTALADCNSLSPQHSDSGELVKVVCFVDSTKAEPEDSS